MISPQGIKNAMSLIDPTTVQGSLQDSLWGGLQGNLQHTIRNGQPIQKKVCGIFRYKNMTPFSPLSGKFNKLFSTLYLLLLSPLW